MKLTDLLLDVGRPVAYYPKLTDVTGGVKETILLCQLLYWQGKQNSHEGWIYKTRDDIKEETGLSRTEQETARRNLKKLGFIEEKLAGVPARMHFKICLEKINQAWEYLDTVDNEEEIEEEPQLAETLPTTWLEPCQLLGGKPANYLAENLPTITENTQESTQRVHSALHKPEAKLGNRRETVVPIEKPSKYVNEIKKNSSSTDIVAETIKRVASTERKQRRKSVVKNANTIVAYWTEQFKECFHVPPMLETGKDKALLKKLIDEHGYDLVVAMIDWMYRNFARYKRECMPSKLNMPTIGMFFMNRGYLYERVVGSTAVIDEKDVNSF